MSGLIFSLLFSSISIPILTRALSEVLRFRRTEEGRGWHGFVEEMGYRVEVYVRCDGSQVHFMLPDLSIPEEVCKAVAKKLAARLYALISPETHPSYEISILGPTASFCHYCLEPVKELLYRCKRCGGLYCSSHRIPEEHNCPGGEVARSVIRIRSEKREERKEEEPKKVILKEVPCG